MRVDTRLIQEAQKRANGATIHSVAGLLLKYRLAARLDERGVPCGEEAKDLESRLRLFVETGRLER
jgi:hypothetical protein